MDPVLDWNGNKRRLTTWLVKAERKAKVRRKESNKEENSKWRNH